MPAWAGGCLVTRLAGCSTCQDYECVMCVYGTDEEIAEAGIVCADTAENYRRYCSCYAGGCPPCREEWQ